MEQSEQLKVIALLAVFGLGEYVEMTVFEDYPYMLKELSDLTDTLENTAESMDELLCNNREEILQIVINYIKGVTT